MAKVNPMHSNILACYPYIIERLKTVKGIKKVAEAQELSLLSSKKQRPDDGNLYVVFDGFSPTNSNNANKEQFIQLGFSLILVKRNYKFNTETDNIGQTLTEIMQVMQGFDPVDCENNNLVTEPFKQAKPLPIRYEDGYAFFSTRFLTEVAVIPHCHNTED